MMDLPEYPLLVFHFWSLVSVKHNSTMAQGSYLSLMSPMFEMSKIVVASPKTLGFTFSISSRLGPNFFSPQIVMNS